MSEQLTAADVLERAADLLTPEGAWIQGWYARDAKGGEVMSRSAAATCFCADGAIRRASDHGKYTSLAQWALVSVLDGEDLTSIYRWNDAPGRTQAEVVAKLREAAQLARREAA